MFLLIFGVKLLSTVVYLINRLPSLALNDDSPYLRLFGHAPNYSNLYIFGCVCFVHLPTHERNKLTAQSVKFAFLGYAGTQKDSFAMILMLVELMSLGMSFFF